jgi:hypothetical protein
MARTPGFGVRGSSKGCNAGVSPAVARPSLRSAQGRVYLHSSVSQCHYRADSDWTEMAVSQFAVAAQFLENSDTAVGDRRYSFHTET